MSRGLVLYGISFNGSRTVLSRTTGIRAEIRAELGRSGSVATVVDPTRGSLSDDSFSHDVVGPRHAVARQLAAGDPPLSRWFWASKASARSTRIPSTVADSVPDAQLGTAPSGQATPDQVRCEVKVKAAPLASRDGKSSGTSGTTNGRDRRASIKESRRAGTPAGSRAGGRYGRGASRRVVEREVEHDGGHIVRARAATVLDPLTARSHTRLLGKRRSLSASCSAGVGPRSDSNTPTPWLHRTAALPGGPTGALERAVAGLSLPPWRSAQFTASRSWSGREAFPASQRSKSDGSPCESTSPTSVAGRLLGKPGRTSGSGRRGTADPARTH